VYRLADKACVQLKDLLTLKQQQAGVIEAREAVKQAAETLKQGQSIMLFTVVTIIFVSPSRPLFVLLVWPFANNRAAPVVVLRDAVWHERRRIQRWAPDTAGGVHLYV
jgi:hypothetical protein